MKPGSGWPPIADSESVSLSSFDICENVTKPEDCTEDIIGEVTKWNIPNGLPEEVLNMDEL